MNNNERKEARYQRRKAKREEKRLKVLETYNFERVTSPDALYRAAKEARREVNWKASVQRYNMNLLRNVLKTSKELRAGQDIRKGFIEFDLMERGKPRHIQSVHFYERVVQKSLCTNALIPHLTRSLIFDNGASIKYKGIHFAFERVKTHLRRHFREHGREGYVLLVDFKGYFANIEHAPILEIYSAAFGEDPELVRLASSFVHAFGDKGLGLGSETSQINAVAFASSIDHYIKEVLRVKYYGRYMDDSYFILPTLEQAKDVLRAIGEKYTEKGITMSPNKTSIVKLTRGFTFLKSHFSITETGRIVARPCRQAAVRQRRKLKKFRKFLDRELMTMEHIRSSYMSWRGFIAHKNAGRTLYNMDALYTKLFGETPITKK